MGSSRYRGPPKPTQRPGKGRRLKAADQPPRDEVFDSWLDERLRALYQNDLSDPLPDDMIDLVRSSTKRGSRDN